VLSGLLGCCPCAPARRNGGKNVSSEFYIECVFENDLVELDANGTLAAAEANEHTLITAETRRLQIAAHWADLHPGDAVAESRLPGTERPTQLGGDGTPTVGDFSPAELGCVLRMSDGSASRLIADALDLRHRLPSIWAAAQAGQVPTYQARRIASATRHLTAEQAATVDQRVAPSLGAVSWGRLERLLEAAIIAADPDAAERAAAAAAQERFVRLGRTSEHGLKLIIARATAGDAIWFKATIDRIADILGRDGDSDSIDVRRSKAIGILAQPAQALQLLCRHQHDNGDGSGEPDEAETEPASEEITCDELDNLDGPDDLRDPDQPADTPQSTVTLTAAGGTDHHSLNLIPPPFTPSKPPRAIIYVHVAAEALSADTTIRRSKTSVLYAGPAPPCSRKLRHQPQTGDHLPPDTSPGQLRNPGPVARTDPLRYSRRRVPLRRCGKPFHIDHTIPHLSPTAARRPAKLESATSDHTYGATTT
jgi:hypothetical protein